MISPTPSVSHQSGRARPVVDEVLPLEEIRAAHARLEAGEQLGKIVLSIA